MICENFIKNTLSVPSNSKVPSNLKSIPSYDELVVMNNVKERKINYLQSQLKHLADSKLLDYIEKNYELEEVNCHLSLENENLKMKIRDSLYSNSHLPQHQSYQVQRLNNQQQKQQYYLNKVSDQAFLHSKIHSSYTHMNNSNSIVSTRFNNKNFSTTSNNVGCCDPDEKALDLALLLSKQEKHVNTNMFDSITVNDGPFLETCSKQGLSYNEACKKLFDKKFGNWEHATSAQTTPNNIINTQNNSNNIPSNFIFSHTNNTTTAEQQHFQQLQQKQQNKNISEHSNLDNNLDNYNSFLTRDTSVSSHYQNIPTNNYVTDKNEKQIVNLMEQGYNRKTALYINNLNSKQQQNQLAQGPPIRRKNTLQNTVQLMQHPQSFIHQQVTQQQIIQKQAKQNMQQQAQQMMQQQAQHIMLQQQQDQQQTQQQKTQQEVWQQTQDMQQQALQHQAMQQRAQNIQQQNEHEVMMTDKEAELKHFSNSTIQTQDLLNQQQQKQYQYQQHLKQQQRQQIEY